MKYQTLWGGGFRILEILEKGELSVGVMTEFHAFVGNSVILKN
jgi:hypothetical protein